MIGSINLKLRESKNGSAKIYLHFNYGRKKQLRYATGFGVKSSANWDLKKQRVKNVSAEPKSILINTKIGELQSYCEKLLDDFTRNNQTITNSSIKTKLDEFTLKTVKKTAEQKPLLDFYKWYIDHFEIHPLPKTQKPLSKNSVRPYRTGLKILEEFNKSNYPINYDDITLSFYEDFTKYLREKDFSQNYIGNQIKHLKAIMNASLERGLHNSLDFKKKAFAKVTEKVHAIYLTIPEIEKLESLEFENERLTRARDLFLIGCYTGLRVSDFNQLTKKNIKTAKNGVQYLEVTPQKTGKTVLIPIHPKVKKILTRYKGSPPKSMPNQHINNFLKVIGVEAELNEKVIIEKTLGGKRQKTAYYKHELLTNHTARRSFCTNAYLAGVSTMDIMAMSGHTSEAVFYDYIKVTPTERLQRLAEHQFFK
ncbi:MAG: phage integrase SAM-like domain-containing protein [Dokdonia sp.]|jgi:integrase